MFQPFFLSRNKLHKIAELFSEEPYKSAKAEFFPGVLAIDFIEPELLELIPCKRPLTVFENVIPFDVQSLSSALTRHANVRKYIFTLAHEYHGNPITLFCSGSKILGEIPFLKLPPTTMSTTQIGLIDNDYDGSMENTFQLVYRIAS